MWCLFIEELLAHTGLLASSAESHRERQPVSNGQADPTAVYHGSDQPKDVGTAQPSFKRLKRLWLFCKSEEHYLSQCDEIAECSLEQILK